MSASLQALHIQTLSPFRGGAVPQQADAPPEPAPPATPAARRIASLRSATPSDGLLSCPSRGPSAAPARRSADPVPAPPRGTGEADAGHSLSSAERKARVESWLRRDVHFIASGLKGPAE